jgi:hypothetical protein
MGCYSESLLLYSTGGTISLKNVSNPALPIVFK